MVCNHGRPGALGAGGWDPIRNHSALERSVSDAFLIMPGILSGFCFGAPCQTASLRARLNRGQERAGALRRQCSREAGAGRNEVRNPTVPLDVLRVAHQPTEVSPMRGFRCSSLARCNTSGSSGRLGLLWGIMSKRAPILDGGWVTPQTGAVEVVRTRVRNEAIDVKAALTRGPGSACPL